jgi:hypothetical protein
MLHDVSNVRNVTSWNQQDRKRLETLSPLPVTGWNHIKCQSDLTGYLLLNLIVVFSFEFDVCGSVHLGNICV